MEKQHLTYFKIENFKRFDSFEMSNLGQFNLIVGDNNVGKTSVLEALCFDEDITVLAYNYLIAFWERSLARSVLGIFSQKEIQQTYFWNTFFKREDSLVITLNDSNFVLELRPHGKLSKEEKKIFQKTIITTIPDHWLKLSPTYEGKPVGDWKMIPAYFEGSSELTYTDRFSLESYIPFISVNAGYAPELVDMYYQFVNSDKILRKEFEENLRSFIPRTEEVRPHKIGNTEVLAVITSDSNILRPITYFGEGTIKYVRLLLEILINQNRRLMVDEIGSGIHFTRLKDYWKTVIQLCAKYNVQLFATTHSLECQQAFVEALDDVDMKQYQKDARNITMLENKKGEVKAFTYDFEQFEYSLNIGINTRGGQL